MTREREIEILMQDGCTRAEAEKHLKNGATIFEDLEKHFESYLKEWDIDEDSERDIRKMVETKKPAPDWGIVYLDGKTYYIMYAL